MPSISLPMLTLMIVGKSLCAPFKIGGGFQTGLHSEIDVALGGSGTLQNDGLALISDSKGIIGGNWKGGAYGRAYGGFNDKYVAGEAAGNVDLGGALQPGLHTALGYDSKGKFPLAFSPTLGIMGNAGVSSNVLATTGNDARSIAARLGDADAIAAIKAEKLTA